MNKIVNYKIKSMKKIMNQNNYNNNSKKYMIKHVIRNKNVINKKHYTINVLITNKHFVKFLNKRKKLKIQKKILKKKIKNFMTYNNNYQKRESKNKNIKRYI